MGLTLRVCLCASPMVKKSPAIRVILKKPRVGWVDGPTVLQVKIKWGRVLLPPHDQAMTSPVPDHSFPV